MGPLFLFEEVGTPFCCGSKINFERMDLVSSLDWPQHSSSRKTFFGEATEGDFFPFWIKALRVVETFFFPFPLFPLSFPTLFLLPPPLAPSLKKLETDHCDDKNVSHYYFLFFRMGVTATAGRSQKRTIKNLFLCHKNFSLLPSPSSSKLNPPPPSFLLLFGETGGGALFFFLSPSLPPFPLREIEMPTAIAHIMQ